jgi:mediator of RNA polymerase II transcription subunit 10
VTCASLFLLSFAACLMARPTITIPTSLPSQPSALPGISGYESPRAGSESPPPEGPQGVIEAELLELAHALYNMGTTVVLDATRDAPPGGKPVGARVNDVVRALAAVDALADGPRAGVNVPIDVLREVDAGQNPEKITRDAVDRAVAENQFMNGKIKALQVRARSRQPWDDAHDACRTIHATWTRRWSKRFLFSVLISYRRVSSRQRYWTMV